MEAVTEPNGARAARIGALAARVAVQASIVAAVATGCWFLQVTRPGLAVAAAIVFVAMLLVARLSFELAQAIVFFFAYTGTGLVLLLVPLLAPASLWLAGLAGLVSGGCSWTTWSAPANWRWPLMLWLLGVAISWPIIAGREADFAVLMPGDAVPFVLLTALSTLCVGVWFDSALSWDLRTIERQIARPLLASAVVAAAAVFYQAFVDITWLSSAIWIQLRRAPGLMGDANPMAVAAALSAPLAILLFRGPAQLPIGVILALLLWAAAWLTGARTVVLLAGAGMIGVTSGAIAERTTPRRAAQFALVAVVMTAGVVLVLALSGAPIGGPIARLTSTLPLDRPVDLLYEVLWQRDGYGAAAATAIREHPWSGVGHGAFYSMSSYFYRLDGGPLIPPDNAQNLWRQSLAERGLLAFPAVVAFTVATFRLLARRPEHSTFFYAWTLKALVIGLGLVLVFGFPIQDAAIALTAASLLAWLYAAVVGPDHDRRPLSPLAIGMVWALALAGAAVDARHARTDLRPPWRAARLADPYSYGFGEIEVGRRGATGRVVTSHAVLALRATGPRYRLRCWVRGNDARHVRVWQNQRLIMDELLPAGVIVERVVNSRPNEPAVFEFRTEPPGMVVSGEFEQ